MVNNTMRKNVLRKEKHIALEKVSSNPMLRLSSGTHWRPIREMLVLNTISAGCMRMEKAWSSSYEKATKWYGLFAKDILESKERFKSDF